MKQFERRQRPRKTQGLVVVNTDKLKANDFNSRKVDNSRIDHLGLDLLGREIKIEVVGGDFIKKKVTAKIDTLYPHMCLCTYEVGPKDGPKKKLKVGLSVPDMVQMGLISFRTGRAEAII